MRRISRRVNSDRYGDWNRVIFFMGTAFEMFGCAGFIGSVTFGGMIVVVISTEVVVVELLSSLKLVSIIGFVIMVVVSMANVVGTVVATSFGSVAIAAAAAAATSLGTVLSSVAALLGASAFGRGSFTRDISILTPASTVQSTTQRKMMMMDGANIANRLDIVLEFYVLFISIQHQMLRNFSQQSSIGR